MGNVSPDGCHPFDVDFRAPCDDGGQPGICSGVRPVAACGTAGVALAGTQGRSRGRTGGSGRLRTTGRFRCADTTDVLHAGSISGRLVVRTRGFHVAGAVLGFAGCSGARSVGSGGAGVLVVLWRGSLAGLCR